ncbi:conserved hypothetical protein [Theileria equi strain WA]|uniref:SAC domain-containing protein n=1 Tax=Theileria equi strain WA TaxID=1537102 RepID=L1LFL3_THEEQ|nr:conserved hypothetical protein [Theileria equi strain WA]EKX74045.1 conserved hypothetical protein [Theileria equi strain WA]|eukprot:XP_004833497.1 conserved hypothetical protein [Theileria equi strain WA]
MNTRLPIRFASVFETDDTVTFVEGNYRIIKFEKNSNNWTILPSVENDEYGSFVCRCYGILGMISFLEGPYLILVTDIKQCGKLFLEHEVHIVESKRLIPLYHPCTFKQSERRYIDLFNQFDISNGFFFSYSYDLTNSVQINRYISQGDIKQNLSEFDSALLDQKFCFNYKHIENLLSHYRDSEPLCLKIIHGYYGESVLNLSGRSLTLTLISRRSRYYAGTRYRKRGIVADGHVANDVETEQIIHDWFMTGSIMSFVQIRGSTPTFWSQDTSQSILIKPPVVFNQNDPTYTSMREHVKELYSLYGSPLIFLNLLSDAQNTDEGELSKRFGDAIYAINNELPGCIQLKYFSKDIRLALEHGIAKKVLKEVIDTVLENTGFFHVRGQNVISVQFGTLRSSCLDCLDRTSALAQHLGLFIFRDQLSRIGITTSNIDAIHYGDTHIPNPNFQAERFNEIKDPILELVKDNYEKMGDVLSMQYAGSKALRKYEGHGSAANLSSQLFTNLKRRYHNYFDDTERQTKLNIFLGIHRAGIHPHPWVYDSDLFIHFEKLHCNFECVDWWVIPLSCFLKRIRLISGDARRPWVELFDDDCEYKPWMGIINAIDLSVFDRCMDEGPLSETPQKKVNFIENTPRPNESYISICDEVRQCGKMVQVIRKGLDEHTSQIQESMSDITDFDSEDEGICIIEPNYDDFSQFMNPENLRKGDVCLEIESIEVNRNIYESFIL